LSFLHLLGFFPSFDCNIRQGWFFNNQREDESLMGLRRNDYEGLQDIGYRTFSDDTFRAYKEKIRETES
jgi:hypothetical protein